MSSALPQQMNAISITKHGSADELKLSQVPLPKVGPKDVLVRVAAAGVNFIDTYHRTGLYAVPLPYTIGREAAGIVDSVGAEVAHIKVGQRVAFAGVGSGSYAQYVSVPAEKVAVVNDQVDLKVAAGVLLQGLTAHYLLTSSYKVKEGDTILIHAAAGGTGGLLVQIAKNVLKARVIATVGSAEKAEIVKQLGVDHIINYSTHNFQEEVMKLTNGKGVQAVYDGVGKSTWEGSLKSVAARGSLIFFGNASGPVPAVDPLLLTKQGSIYLTRPSLVDFLATREELEWRCSELFSWIATNKVNFRIAKEFPLAEAAEAHKFLESRQALGKILLIP